MRICDNGIYRDATPEEIEAFNNTPEPKPGDEAAGEEDYIQVLDDLGVDLL